MATIPKRAVTHIATGAIMKYGRTDFTGQFDPLEATQQDLDDSANFVSGVPTYHHKVVGTLIEEMTAPEKAAATLAKEQKEVDELKFPVVVTKVVANLAALPVPPPKKGVIVGVANIAGSPGMVISTNTNYLVFQSDGVHP